MRYCSGVKIVRHSSSVFVIFVISAIVPVSLACTGIISRAVVSCRASSPISRSLIGIVIFQAFRADPMGEVGIGVVSYGALHGMPLAFLVTDLFAIRADGQEASQHLDFPERLFQFLFAGLAAFGLALKLQRRAHSRQELQSIDW